MTARHLIWLGLFLSVGVASAAAKPAYVASTVNLRAAPGTTNEIVAKIPGGSLVDAGACTDGWCAVTWQDKEGFAIQTALDLSGRVPSRGPAAGPGPVAGPYVVDEGPVYVAPGPYYAYPGYYPGCCWGGWGPRWGWHHRRW
ncbi:MAG TPA: SH3 domain-containing protein [Pseudolabrys sp.]|nr:SH3 domain-containing protein [Pseudolabrys sp.]